MRFMKQYGMEYIIVFSIIKINEKWFTKSYARSDEATVMRD